MRSSLKHLSMLLALIPFMVHCQVHSTSGILLYADTLEFRPLHNWIVIEDPESNIWETGMPDKDYFNAPFSGSLAMMTDTAGFYGSELDNSFVIQLPWDEYFWGEGILSFYHKYDTDHLKDGGLIEVSYDEGATWMNVRDDIDHIESSFLGLYEDTISGGDYAYSGRSDGWQYVELYWWWLALTKKSVTAYTPVPFIRFRFLSDDLDTGKEGWMIDDLVFRGYDVSGFVGDHKGKNAVVFPDPASELIHFKVRSSFRGVKKVALYNGAGQLVKLANLNSHWLDISDIKSGIYFYRIIQDNQLVASGKFIKQ